MEYIDKKLLCDLIKSLDMNAADFLQWCHKNDYVVHNVTVFDGIYEKVCIYKRDVVFKLNGEFLTIMRANNE